MVVATLAGALLAACGGGAETTPTPTPTLLNVGGTVSGLGAGSVVLRNNGANDLTISANGNFTFSTQIASGGSYAVTVATQPANPSQTCTVTGGSGTATANVATVAVTCATNTFTLGGSIAGLAAGQSVVLANGATNLTLSANGAFNFPVPITSGSAYAVTVNTQPTNQVCSVTNGSGTIGAAAVANVTVTCSSNAYTLGGTVSGLTGAGLVLRNGTTSLSVATSGAFTFPATIASGTTYAVSVQTQPAGQTCSVANGSGTVTTANITNVAVTCSTGTSSFTIGGTVSGLAGTGLVLQNNGGNNLTVAAGSTTFTFSTALASGATYAVTRFTNPSTPSQTCTVSSGSGTVGSANVTSVAVNCVTNTFAVNVNVSGLTGSGLVLRNNGGNNLAVTADGTSSFTTLVASGATYNVTVFSQPVSPTQLCTVASSTGTMGSAAVTVNVTCVTPNRSIGGTVSGLTSSGLQLQNNGGDTLSVTSGATTFTFATLVSSGSSYSVTVLQQPSSQTCTVSNGSGTVGSSNITNVSVSCSGGGGKFAFYSNESGTPQVASYSVGANGGFSLVSAMPVASNSQVSGAHATGVAVTPTGGHVIVAVDADDSVQTDGELQVYSVNGSGALTYVSRTRMNQHSCSGVGNPGNSGDLSCGIAINSAPETVVIHPNGRFVYVMDGVAHGACIPANVAPCSPPAGFPAGGNRTIVRYTFDPGTGTLTYNDQHYCEGFISLAIDPQGRFLWCTSYLERRIYEFQINQSTGALTFGTGTFIGMSDGDMWLGIDPNGNYAYAAHEGDRTIDSYSINQSNGHLTNLEDSPGNYNKVFSIDVWSLAVSANGRTLYGGSGGVTAFALGTDGRIDGSSRTSYNPAVPMNGYRAQMGIGSNGQYLYLQGYSESAARVYSINPSTGVPSETAASPSSILSGAGGITQISLQ